MVARNCCATGVARLADPWSSLVRYWVGSCPVTRSCGVAAIPYGKAWLRTASNPPAAVEIELVERETSPTEGLTVTWPMVDWLTAEVAVVWRLTAVVAVVERWLTIVVAWVLS